MIDTQNSCYTGREVMRLSLALFSNVSATHKYNDAFLGVAIRNSITCRALFVLPLAFGSLGPL